MIKKIISGGQTGVDRAALDVAIELGIPHGGWCPKGKWAEDGTISEKYQLKETSSTEPAERTKLNVRDSDGTLIIIKTEPVGEGSQLTIDEAKRLKKPLLVIDLSQKDLLISLRDWILQNNIRLLNVAGPRASQQAGIYDDAYQFLLKQLAYNVKPKLKCPLFKK